MTEPYNFAAQCKRLADEAIPVTEAWHKRIAEGPQPLIRKDGRVFKDEDPKRGAQSPLGGKVW